MLAIIDRQRMLFICNMQAEAILPPLFRESPYVLVDLNIRLPLALFTDMEMKMLYREMGAVVGTVVNDRQSLETSVLRMLHMKPVCEPHDAIFEHLKAGRKQRKGTAGESNDAGTPRASAQRSQVARTESAGAVTTPAEGSVTQRIFAACDAALLELGTSNFKDARLKAIENLIAAGVNKNSAYKGSMFWINSKK